MGICATQNKKSTKTKYQIQDFQFKTFLGKGGFGQVWKVKQKQSKKIYALKILEKSLIIKKKSVKQILNERNILTQLLMPKQNGIINIEAAFQDKRRLYILMQYIEGKTLRQLLVNQYIFEKNQQKYIIFSLIKILQTLYNNKVIHHDFKPQNIIIDKSGHPQLIDFGLSSFCFEDNRDINGGTLQYLAPQILSDYNHYYTADYYSLGITIYEIFFQKRPYSAKTISQMIAIQRNKAFNQKNFPEILQIDPLAKDLIIKLLQRTQIKRLGYHGIQQILDHPYFKDIQQCAPPHSLILKNGIQSTAVSRSDLSSSQKTTLKPSSIPILNHLLQESFVQQMFINFDYSPNKKAISVHQKQ